MLDGALNERRRESEKSRETLEMTIERIASPETTNDGGQWREDEVSKSLVALWCGILTILRMLNLKQEC